MCLGRSQLKPAATASFERNTLDVVADVNAILRAQSEVVVQICANRACAEFIKQACTTDYGGQFFSISFVGSNAPADELGAAGMGVVISQVVPSPHIPISPVVREYKQRMKEAGQTEQDFSSMEVLPDWQGTCWGRTLHGPQPYTG